jgi:hypothetical protein
MDLLRSGDDGQRCAGFVIARDMRPADPRMEGVLMELLGNLSFEQVSGEPMRIAGRGKGELLLLLIAELRLATPGILSTLRSLQHQFARCDAFLVDCVRVVLNELDPVNHAAPGSVSSRMFRMP